MLVKGYHGTTSRAKNIKNGSDFEIDRNKRPKWLGPGVYFFQDGPNHAMQWAKFLSNLRKEPPLVFEAEIDLTDCLDFLDTANWPAFRTFLFTAEQPLTLQIGPNGLFQNPMPKSIGLNHEDDFYLRRFITQLERYRRVKCVRSAFIEGKPLHQNSWLFDEAHVAICVRFPEAIRNIREVRLP